MLLRFSHLLALSGLVVAGLVGTDRTADAAFTFTAASAGSALAGASYANFNDLAVGAKSGTSGGVTVSITGSGSVVNGSLANQYAAPTLSTGNNMFFGPAATGRDTTNYLSSGNGSTTLTFNGTQTYLGLLWGSTDRTNSLTFFNGTTNVGVLTGAMVNALAGSSKTTDSLYVNIFSTLAFTSVVATNGVGVPSFELDNVAYGTVPEPSSLALCGVAGLLGLGIARFRGKRVV